MSVPSWTTPTFTLTFTQQGLDLTQAHNVYVTFRSGQNVITKTGEDLTIAEKEIGVFLSQAETGMLAPGMVEIQANWTTGDGGRAASEIVRYEFSPQLLKAVIE